MLNKVNKYKALQSKKHYANIYNSANMQGVLDYGFSNTKGKKGAGRKLNNQHKNASSVGNPITFKGIKGTDHEPKANLRKKGRFSKDLYSTTGNFKLDGTGKNRGEFWAYGD